MSLLVCQYLGAGKRKGLIAEMYDLRELTGEGSLNERGLDRAFTV